MHLFIVTAFEKSPFTCLDKNDKIEPAVVKWQASEFLHRRPRQNPLIQHVLYL